MLLCSVHPLVPWRDVVDGRVAVRAARGPSLVALALALLASPLVDRALARHVALPAGWLRLRLIVAGGLGLMTLLIAAA